MYLLDSFHWSQLLQPQWYVENGGLWLLLFVVFAETGLFVGFFLPGDSLLFVAGIFAHKMENGEPGLAYQFLKLFGLGGIRSEWIDLFTLVALISFVGILGNAVGYWTGKKVGPAMYHWKDRFLFKKRYLYQAHDFYEKHGGLAIIGARFLPFIRTFAPIVAGIVQMDRKKFHFFNIAGCIAWVFTMIFAGYFLQKWVWDLFKFDLKEHLEIIVLGIVLVTTAPVIIKMFSSRKKTVTDKTPPVKDSNQS
ncbi:MAG: VTT domain-containing protein [Chitinophagaceae bacterium]|nr:VTT domain-containing protein [Chitinophagaceae bacterium]MBL0273769.1 VTT domain-containing protein [Chitinophagaceae bacterium]